MILDIINLVKVRRAIICALVLLAVIFIQETVLAHVYVLGTRAMIIPIAVVAIGFWCGGVWGGVFGIIAGIFTDMSLNSFSLLTTVLFPFIGFFAGTLPMFYMSRKLLTFFFLNLSALALTAFCQMFRYLVFTDTPHAALLITGLLQVLLSLPFVIAIYYPCRKIYGWDLNK